MAFSTLMLFLFQQPLRGVRRQEPASMSVGASDFKPGQEKGTTTSPT